MVVKVIGKTDTFTVIFDRIDEKRWNALVPANVAGEYIMDLFAYDDAGNVGYMATAMFTVDTSNLCFHLEIINYQSCISLCNDYICEIMEVLPCRI